MPRRQHRGPLSERAIEELLGNCRPTSLTSPPPPLIHPHTASGQRAYDRGVVAGYRERAAEHGDFPLGIYRQAALTESNRLKIGRALASAAKIAEPYGVTITPVPRSQLSMTLLAPVTVADARAQAPRLAQESPYTLQTTLLASLPDAGQANTTGVLTGVNISNTTGEHELSLTMASNRLLADQEALLGMLATYRVRELDTPLPYMPIATLSEVHPELEDQLLDNTRSCIGKTAFVFSAAAPAPNYA